MTQNANAIAWILITFAEIEMLFFSGMIYGINALYPTLIDLSYFCSTKNITESCPNQKVKLGYLYITVTVSTAVFSVPIGIIMDHCGGSVTKILCAMSGLLGFLTFALSSVISNYLAFLACVLLGYFVYSCMMGNFAMARLIPEYQSAIVSTFSCSFDFSCIVMTFIALLYKAGIHILWSFTVMAVVCALLCSASAILNKIIITISKNKIHPLSDDENPEVSEDEEPLQYSNRYLERIVNKRYPTLNCAITSRFYILHIMELSILCLCMNLFLSELNIKLHHLFPDDRSLVDQLLEHSNYVLAGGVLLSPLPGIFIDFLKTKNEDQLLLCDEANLYRRVLTPFTSSLVLCGLVSQSMFVLLMFPHKEAIYVAYVMLMILRVILFSTNSLYLLNGFPKRYFGQLLGIGFFISGMFSFIQYGLIFEDRERLNIVNYAMIGIIFISYIHPIMLNVRQRGDRTTAINAEK